MRLSTRLIGAQDRFASWLGGDPAARSAVVANMLDRNGDAAGYWLKLGISVGIATLGLVLGSSAVVIGAMLIAPLMTPLVNLGMGLAVGSPFLVLRSSARVIASIGVAAGASALITRLLPFNELNDEIASRTTPTALDLLVAAFCALAGVLAVMRRDSDVASTAAGTSIGISLVPPLCVSGYGIGASTWTVASGAALLFLTNFVAIVVVSTLSFAASGFNQIDIRRLEAEQLGGHDDAPVTRRLARVFASRGGPWLRLLMPIVLLAAVYVPLRQALDEVVWQIRARKQVEAVIAGLPYRLVQSRVHIERRRIQLTLVLLGSSADAAKARLRVEQGLGVEAGVVPRVEVVAIPDAGAFANLQAALHRDAPLPQPPPTALAEQAALAQRGVRALLDRRWPANAAGRVASLYVESDGGGLILRIVHLGAPLENAARDLLERILSEDAGGPIRVVARALPTNPLTPASLEEPEFLTTFASLLEARPAERVSVCLVIPEPAKKPGARSESGPPKNSALRTLLDGRPHVQITQGPSPSVRFVLGSCPESEAAGVPASPAAASAAP
jgi:uncharacterized hydrophobic protein (TIGR00271 family)